MDASDWVSAQYGRALDFDGTNDKVAIPNIQAFVSGTQLTASLWVKRNSAGAYYELINKFIATSQVNEDGWLFRWDNNNKLLFTIAQSGTYSQYLATNASTTVDWTHVAVIHEFGTAAKTSLFFNGQVISAAWSGNGALIPDADATADDITLGSQFYNNINYNLLAGQLDDIRLYSRILAEAEIKLLASEPAIGFKRNTSAFATRYTYKPAKPRNYSVIRNRDPNYSTLRQGLVAAYCPSISGQGNVIPDLVGGNHGTLTNMTAEDWVASGDGRALDFDGSNDYVLTSNPVLSGTGDFTVTNFFKINTASRFHTFQGNYTASNLTGIQFGIFNTNKLFAYVASGSSLVAGTTLNANQWYSASVVRQSGVITIYLNGVPDGSATRAGSIGTSSNWRLGQGDTGEELAAQLDDARVYNRALTESEIKLLASKRGIGLEPRKPKITFTDLGVQKTYSVVRVKETDYATLRQGLVGAWCPSLPNGGSGNTLPDVSGYGNHGVLTNMGPEDWVSAQYGRALDFDGVNDRVDCGNILNSVFAGSEARFTVCGWVNTTVNANQLALAKLDGTLNQRQWFLRTNDDGLDFAWYGAGDASSFRVARAALTFSTSGWVPFAVTFDATISSADQKVSIYLLGLQQSVSIPFSVGTPVSIQTGTASLSFASGFANSIANNFFTGQLDDIRVYNRVLTPNEIRLLASRPGIGLRQESHRNTFYQFPSFQPALARRSSAIIGGGIT